MDGKPQRFADGVYPRLTLDAQPTSEAMDWCREGVDFLYDLIGISSDRDFTELLFGPGLEKGQRTATERRLAILGAIISAANLESHFRPKLLSQQLLR